MNLLKEINYLFDFKLKIKLIGMIPIILFGALAELMGVAIILPIIELATNDNAVSENRYCKIISNITGITDSKRVLLVFIGLAILLYVLKNIYLAFMTYMMNRFSKNIRMIFAERLMQAYMKQPYSYFLQKNTAEILRSIMNDTVNLYTVIANVLHAVSQSITALMIIIFLAVTNFKMTCVIALVLGGTAIFIVFILQKKMRRLGRVYQKTYAEIMQSAKQAFEGIKEVKIMNKERVFISDFCSIYHKATKLELIFNLISSLPKYIIETICIGGILIYLALVIIQGGDMGTMIPQLSVFAMGAFKLLPSVNALYLHISNVLYNKNSIDLIYQNICETEEYPDKYITNTEMEPLVFENSIIVEGISFHYENVEKDVLKDISLIIHKGESIAFIGESGSGKTTLVDVILGILEPYEGKIKVDGRDIKEIPQQWHRDIGYIPQNIFLMDDTIRRNVAFGIIEEDIDDDKVWEALRDAQMYDFVKGLEHGIDTKVGEDGTRLSGGQRQRIGIARALYYNPDILVFDEATSALDTETEKEVMEAVNHLHGAKTMIMIAHRLSTIENCDHVYRVEGQHIEKMR